MWRDRQVADDVWLLRFRNWARWASARGSRQGQAFSIEGHFRLKSRVDDTPTGWGDWLTTPPQYPPLPPLDSVDAVLVNRGYVHLWLVAERQAKIIKILTFRSYLRPQWQAQKLGMHWTELEEAYHRAKLMMRNQVFILEKKGYTSRTVKPVTLRGCEA